MLAFITSLRSKTVANDWKRVCALFERTACSVFNQTTPHFRLIVTCHERPILTKPFDERLEFIEVDFPPPDRREHILLSNDKVKKLIVALNKARDCGASFVMPLDADDMVSNRLVAFVLARPRADGWYVRHGWRYYEGQKWIERLGRFNQVCGSCNILSRRWFNFSKEPELERDADENLISEGHDRAVLNFRERGVALRPVPFRAIIYVCDGGENLSALDTTYLPSGPIRYRSPVRVGLGRIKSRIKNWTTRRLVTHAVETEFQLKVLGD